MTPSVLMARPEPFSMTWMTRRNGIDATLADPRCSRPWAVAVLHQGDEVNLTRWGPAKGLPKLVTPNVSRIKAQGQPQGERA